MIATARTDATATEPTDAAEWMERAIDAMLFPARPPGVPDRASPAPKVTPGPPAPAPAAADHTPPGGPANGWLIASNTFLGRSTVPHLGDRTFICRRYACKGTARRAYQAP